MNDTFMLGFLAKSSETTVGERILEGGQIVILGMLTVFAVLAILWGILALSKIFFYDNPAKKSNAKDGNASINEEKEEAPVAKETASTPCEEDDGAIVAAITAAVSEYLKDDAAYAGGFRVVSFRRNGSSWNKKSN